MAFFVVVSECLAVLNELIFCLNTLQNILFLLFMSSKIGIPFERVTIFLSCMVAVVLPYFYPAWLLLCYHIFILHGCVLRFLAPPPHPPMALPYICVP